MYPAILPEGFRVWLEALESVHKQLLDGMSAAEILKDFKEWFEKMQCTNKVLKGLENLPEGFRSWAKIMRSLNMEFNTVGYEAWQKRNTKPPVNRKLRRLHIKEERRLHKKAQKKKTKKKTN